MPTPPSQAPEICEPSVHFPTFSGTSPTRTGVPFIGHSLLVLHLIERARGQGYRSRVLPLETSAGRIARIRDLIDDVQHARDRTRGEPQSEQLLRDYETALEHLRAYLKHLEAAAT